MAMDYLPIQVTAVPCKCIFLSSAKTDTKQRNSISPLLMEALQMLKFHMKKERLNFMASWATAEKEMMVEDDSNQDLLAKLLNDSFQENFECVIKAIKSNDED